MEEYERYKQNERLQQEKKEKRKAEEEELAKKREMELKMAKQKNKAVKRDFETTNNTNQLNSQSKPQTSSQKNLNKVAPLENNNQPTHNKVLVEVRPLPEPSAKVAESENSPEHEASSNQNNLNTNSHSRVEVNTKHENVNLGINITIPKKVEKVEQIEFEPYHHVQVKENNNISNENENKHHQQYSNKENNKKNNNSSSSKSNTFKTNQLHVKNAENVHLVAEPKEIEPSKAEKEFIKNNNEQLMLALVSLI